MQIKAPALKFDPTAITAKADQPFRIEFDNQDPNTPHNVAIHKDSPTGAEVFKGEVFSGVAKKTYDVPALDGRDLRLRLYRASDDDRHAHGPVRSHRWRRPR